MSRKSQLKGLVKERVLRRMIRAIARELSKELSVREKLALLKQQERNGIHYLVRCDAVNAL